MRSAWNPLSWKDFPTLQQPTYQDQEALSAALVELRKLPPLVTSWEIDHLKQQIAQAQQGDGWLLQGGDCAETFDDCQAEPIASKLKVLLQMSLAILFGARCRIIRVGRMAGQYAKPRSQETETLHGVTLPCYRGDLINDRKFTKEARLADPQRLLKGYERAAITMNFVRGLSEGGFADLHQPSNWNLVFVSEVAEAARYQQLVARLSDALSFMETVANPPRTELRRVDFFASHEALHLDYEAALTRPSVRGVGYYDFSTHLPWIGERTRNIGGGHIEFFRGIRNPIAVKIGPSMTPDELVELVERLNPDKEPGRMTLIHRLGHQHIAKTLPPLIQAVQARAQRVLWVCDPMHGNTLSTTHGRKTRRFEDIVSELRTAFDVHRQLGSRLGGVHLELTGENVTECVGGSRGLTEGDLDAAYQTQLDPRLNYEQAMEIAFDISQQLADFRN